MLMPILAIIDCLVNDTKRMDSVRVPVVVLANATTKEVFEAFEGEVGVVDKDNSGGGTFRGCRRGRRCGRQTCLLIVNQIQVVRVEHALTPVDAAGLGLAHRGSFRFGRCGRERRFRGDPHVRFLGNVRVKLACC